MSAGKVHCKSVKSKRAGEKKQKLAQKDTQWGYEGNILDAVRYYSGSCYRSMSSSCAYPDIVA